MTARPFRGIARGRRGFTLLELLLVLALIAALAAMAWPSINGMFDTQRLNEAADQVRAAWARARYDALNSGRTMVFSYYPETTVYTTEPWQSEAAATFGETPDEVSVVWAIVENQLPEGVVFVGSEIQADMRAYTVAATHESTAANSIGVLFYPDGTTSTARLMLRNTRQQCVTIELRGLTGISTVGEITLESQ